MVYSLRSSFLPTVVVLTILMLAMAPPAHAKEKPVAAASSFQVGPEDTLRVPLAAKCGAPARQYSPQESQAAASKAMCCLKQRGKRWVLGVEFATSPGLEMGAGAAGVPFIPHVRILNILHGLPAAKAGIKYGDVVTHINGSPVGTAQAFLDAVNNSNGKVLLRILRGGKVLTKTVRLKKL